MNCILWEELYRERIIIVSLPVICHFRGITIFIKDRPLGNPLSFCCRNTFHCRNNFFFRHYPVCLLISVDQSIVPVHSAFTAGSVKYDEAFAAYKKCTEIKDDYYDAWYQCGLCKYRQALAMNATVSSIKNQTLAKKTLETTKGLFGEAIPFFEKARECAPDEPQKWAFELRQCYSVTGQADKAAEMDKLL